MEKCTIKYFKYNNNEIKFKNGVNFIIGSNGSGKSTLLLIIQHSLGLLSIPTKVILETTTTIELVIKNNSYRFIRETDSNEISIESDHNKTFKFNVSSEAYNKFLISLFKPNMDLTENSQIKTLICDAFYSSDLRSKMTQNHLAYLMLGIDKKYEDDIKKKINILSDKVKEKEKIVDLINQYKDDVLNALSRENSLNIHGVMNEIYEKYKKEQLSDREILQKSEYILDELRNENKINLERTVDYLDFLYVSCQMNYKENIRSNIMDILLKKNDYQSGGEKTYNEVISKLLIQSGHSHTNGIGILFNDYASQFLSNDAKNKIRNIAEITANKENLQYIELTHTSENIDKDKIVYDLDNINKDRILSILNRELHHG